jgi:hypothetical protein
MPELKPLERKTVSAGGRLPLSAGRYGCSAQAPGGIKLPRLYDCLVIAKTGGGWQGGEWYTAGAKAGDFSGNFELAARHAFSFKLEYDGTSLLLYADVKDDFLFKTSRESHKGELCDGLEIYIDGREPRDIGRAAYEKGVYQVMAYPGTPGKYPAFFTSPQGIKDISLSAELTDRGYRMKAVIPFASFCAGKGVPDKIGFDLGANSADERGERAGQFIFAGSDNNWIDASGFIDVWLR